MTVTVWSMTNGALAPTLLKMSMFCSAGSAWFSRLISKTRFPGPVMPG